MKRSSWLKKFFLGNAVALGLIFSQQALGTEIKEAKNVDINSLMDEISVSSSQAKIDEIAMAVWIPQEFWEVTLSKDDTNTIPSATKIELLSILKSYFLVGVVQGEVNNSEGFKFYSLDEIEQNLTFYYEDEAKNRIALPPANTVSPEVESLLTIMKPLFEQLLGNAGKNLHFIVFADRTDRGDRIVSPYETGAIEIQLTDSNKTVEHELEIVLPLNSLHVPRICPNDKEAHISWKYCPWDGTKLP